MQGAEPLAKQEIPNSVKQRTAEDNLWLALSSLVADKRLQLLVTYQCIHGRTSVSPWQHACLQCL